MKPARRRRPRGRRGARRARRPRSPRVVVHHVALHALRPLEATLGETELRSLTGERLDLAVAEARRVRGDRRRRARPTASPRGVFEPLDPKLTAFAVISMCTNVGIWYRPDGRLTLSEVARSYATMATRLAGAAPADPALVDRVLAAGRRGVHDLTEEVHDGTANARGVRREPAPAVSRRSTRAARPSRTSPTTRCSRRPWPAGARGCAAPRGIPRCADTMVTSPDLNGEECHVFWHMATEPRGPAAEPARRADALGALAAVGLRVDRPRRAAGAADRHAARRPRARHVLPPARRRLREAVPARAADDGRGRHRRQGRPQQAARRPGRPRPLPARRRAPRRRHRRARREGPHVGLGGRERARDHPAAGDARRRTPTTPSSFAIPVDTPGIKLVCRGLLAARTPTSSRRRCRATTT